MCQNLTNCAKIILTPAYDAYCVYSNARSLKNQLVTLCTCIALAALSALSLLFLPKGIFLNSGLVI